MIKFIIILIIAVAAVSVFIYKDRGADDLTIGKTTVTPDTKQWELPPDMQIDQNKQYLATLYTNKGDIKLELFASEAPFTVNNFVFLAREGFYDGIKFHRIIKDFMIQGGDPTGTGRGGPGYVFNDEAIAKEYARGIIAMANAGPNTNGSQFFIMHKDIPLPKNYVIFGQVTEGLDTVDKIAETEVGPNDFGELSAPTKDVIIKNIKVEEK